METTSVVNGGRMTPKPLEEPTKEVTMNNIDSMREVSDSKRYQEYLYGNCMHCDRPLKDGDGELCEVCQDEANREDEEE